MKVETLGAEALDLAYEQGLDFTDPAECAWALLVDAARTFSRLPGDGPRGFPRQSAMPEQVRSKYELFGVERERISDRVEVETDVRFTASSREVTRAHEVQLLWQPQTFRTTIRKPEPATRAMWLVAGGTQAKKAARLCGLNKSSIYRLKPIMSLTVGRIILPYAEKLKKAA